MTTTNNNTLSSHFRPKPTAFAPLLAMLALALNDCQRWRKAAWRRLRRAGKCRSAWTNSNAPSTS